MEISSEVEPLDRAEKDISILSYLRAKSAKAILVPVIASKPSIVRSCPDPPRIYFYSLCGVVSVEKMIGTVVAGNPAIGEVARSLLGALTN